MSMTLSRLNNSRSEKGKNLTAEEILNEMNWKNIVIMEPALGLMIVFFVAGVAGNSVTLNLYLTRLSKNSSSKFYVTMAVYSLLTSGVCVPLDVYNSIWRNVNHDIEPLCQVYRFFVNTVMVASVFLLSCMAVDCYVRVCHPWHFVSQSVILNTCISTAAISIGIHVPMTFVVFGLTQVKWEQPEVVGYRCLIQQTKLSQRIYDGYSLFLQVLFALTLFILTVCYGMVFRKWRQMKTYSYGRKFTTELSEPPLNSMPLQGLHAFIDENKTRILARHHSFRMSLSVCGSAALAELRTVPKLLRMKSQTDSDSKFETDLEISRKAVASTEDRLLATDFNAATRSPDLLSKSQTVDSGQCHQPKVSSHAFETTLEQVGLGETKSSTNSSKKSEADIEDNITAKRDFLPKEKSETLYNKCYAFLGESASHTRVGSNVDEKKKLDDLQHNSSVVQQRKTGSVPQVTFDLLEKSESERALCGIFTQQDFRHLPSSSTVDPEWLARPSQPTAGSPLSGVDDDFSVDYSLEKDWDTTYVDQRDDDSTTSLRKDVSFMQDQYDDSCLSSSSKDVSFKQIQPDDGYGTSRKEVSFKQIQPDDGSVTSRKEVIIKQGQQPDDGSRATALSFMVVSILFFVSYGFVVVMLPATVIEQQKWQLTASSMVMLRMSYLHNSCSPFIYWYFNARFRTEAGQLVKRLKYNLLCKGVREFFGQQ